jgi:hypothetical protein
MRARENPFRSERLERLAFRHALPLEAIHARWTALGRRAAVVGPHGSGKTTLLRALAASAEREGFRVERWFLNAESGRPSTRELTRAARRLGPRDVLCFDGAGHLGPLAWHRVRRAARAAGGVLATAHAPGLLPTLVETGTDAALLDELACELLAADTGPLRPLLAELHARHRGNLRDVFLALYDLAASADPRMVMPGHAPRRPRARRRFL